MVPAVHHGGIDDSHDVPQPGHREVRSHDDRAQDEGKDVGHDLLHWVAVGGGDTDGCGPLVVDLVDVLVNPSVV